MTSLNISRFSSVSALLVSIANNNFMVSDSFFCNYSGKLDLSY